MAGQGLVEAKSWLGLFGVSVLPPIGLRGNKQSPLLIFFPLLYSYGQAT